MIVKLGPANSHETTTTSAPGRIPAAKLPSVLSQRIAVARNSLVFGRKLSSRAPPPVHLPVTRPGRRPVPPRRDHRLRSASLRSLQHQVGAGGPAAHQRPERRAVQEVRNPRQIMRLPGRDRGVHRVPERVHDGDGPALQATLGAPDSLVLALPLFAPTAGTPGRTVPPGSDFLPGSMSPIRAQIPSVSAVLPAFIMSPACSARAAVPAVTGGENGMEPDEPQPECQPATVTRK